MWLSILGWTPPYTNAGQLLTLSVPKTGFDHDVNQIPPDSATQTRRLGKGMVAAAWLLALGLLTLFFNNWLDSQRNPNQRPGIQVGQDGGHEVVLRRNRFGHYVANGYINAKEVEFLVDTGASDVAIPAGVARRLGLRPGRPVTYHTANGAVTAYRTTIDDLRLGSIQQRNVAASINPNMGGNSILLGMSFLKHLEFTQMNETLVLRQ